MHLRLSRHPKHPPFYASDFPALQSVAISGLEFYGAETVDVLMQEVRYMIDWLATLPLVLNEEGTNMFSLSCLVDSAAFCSKLAR
jgi:hypothetical protein